ncbi:hypothetical protein [Streptomyces montanisoli]|uniref:Uncharacterized protein n=1 Tax=Streptomyces montanisoli TaxID=2798581 RepID=A0A940RUR4_9ACTN|nr:hypothetical protein [Streptomyces montanisoli]MBP0457495.1 hypothetical protein [Streptomyces montanisoli]
MRCTHWRSVPSHLAWEAREGWAAECVDTAVRCQLPTHGEGTEHFGLLGDLGEYGTALWLRWRGKTEVDLAILLDCPVSAPGPDGEGCCLFVGHTEQHTWVDTPEEG